MRYIFGCVLALTICTSSYGQEPSRREQMEQRLQEELARQRAEQQARQGDRRSQRVRMQQVEVTSPGGEVTFTLLPNAERLSFTVTRRGQPVLDPSPIIMKVNDFDLSQGIVYMGEAHYEIDETYPWHGMKDTAHNHARGALVELVHDLSFITYTIDIRVFDDGVAFRHMIPGEPDESRVPDEYTTFVIPAGSHVWHHNLAGHYESAYNDEPAEEIEPGTWAGPPVTYKLPWGGYGLITEANLVDYAGMALEADGRRGLVAGLGHRHPLNYPYELRYGREEARRLAQAASITGTITTPWRVVMACADLNELANSTIVPNLAPPPDPQYFPDGIKTSWTAPGRAVWRYVDGGQGDFEGLMAFSRLAGELGFEYHILEGVWARWTDEQLRQITDYSAERGVGLVVWRHSRQLRTPEAIEDFFGPLSRIGIAGAKIDFFDHEAKEVVDLYEVLLERAAAHQMVLNFHGSNKPTGRERTWPNMVVTEAVSGMERSSFLARARHQTILPFTRYIAGPADYTTLHFGDRRGDTTWPHQIASFATFDSPMLTLAAHPQNVLENPAAGVIKDIPAVWDETIVLPGSEIGELSIFARRTGDVWFLAVMCGVQRRTIRVPLAFLGEHDYQATLIRDHPDQDDSLLMEQTSVRRSETLTIELRSGGGFVGRFAP